MSKKIPGVMRRFSLATKSGPEKEMREENIRIQALSLNFTDEQREAAFRSHHAQTHTTRLRFLCVAVGIASVVQIILDLVDGDVTTAVFRGMTIVLLQLILLLTFRRQLYLRLMQGGMGQHVVASVVCLLIMTGRVIRETDKNGVKERVVDEADTGFLFLILGGLCTLAAVRYTAGLIAASLTTLWFIVAAIIWHQDTAMDTVTTCVTGFLALLVFLYVARDFELSERRDFVLTSRLREEKVDLNLQLEGFALFSTAAKQTKKKMAGIGHCILDSREVKRGKELGRGGFGAVHDGRWRQTDVAIKILSSDISQAVMQEFHDEAVVMSQMRHPNVVLFMGLCVVPPMLVMELMPRGSVYKILHQSRVELHWTLILQMAMDTARGMNFLHTFNPPLVHRDLKSLNLLVARDWRVKVGDFGLASLQERVAEQSRAPGRGGGGGAKGSSASGSTGAGAGAGAGAEETKEEKKSGGGSGKAAPRRQDDVGTLAWSAPEVFARGRITSKADVYSYGIILYELLARKEPFKAKPVHAIPYLVLKGTRPDSIDPVERVDPNLQEMVPLMKRCWDDDPSKRPSFEKILDALNAMRQEHLKITSGTFEDHVVLPSTRQTAPDASPKRSDVLPASLQAGFTVDMKSVEIGPKIGRGGNAFVYEGLYQGTHVAVKELFVKVAQEELLAEFQKECSLMMMLRHPNIVLFMGSGAASGKLYMITELMVNGSLFQIYHQHRRDAVSMKRRLSMCADAARGMQYLHALKPPLIHRDLKSPNVLVDANWVAKIADFGLSRYKDDSKTMTTCGSPLWAAPEVLRGERFGEPCDVYSFAIIVWELVAWEEPYQGMDSMQVMTQVARYKLRPPIPAHTSGALKQLLRAMWDDDQHKRPTFATVLEMLEDMLHPS